VVDLTSITFPLTSLLRHKKIRVEKPLRPWIGAFLLLTLTTLFRTQSIEFRLIILLLFMIAYFRSGGFYSLICLTTVTPFIFCDGVWINELLALSALASALVEYKIFLDRRVRFFLTVLATGTLKEVKSGLGGWMVGWILSLIALIVQTILLAFHVSYPQSTLFLTYNIAVLYCVQAFLVRGWKKSSLILSILPYLLLLHLKAEFSTFLGLILFTALSVEASLLISDADYYILSS